MFHLRISTRIPSTSVCSFLREIGYSKFSIRGYILRSFDFRNFHFRGWKLFFFLVKFLPTFSAKFYQILSHLRRSSRPETKFLYTFFVRFTQISSYIPILFPSLMLFKVLIPWFRSPYAPFCPARYTVFEIRIKYTRCFRILDNVRVSIYFFLFFFYFLLVLILLFFFLFMLIYFI